MWWERRAGLSTLVEPREFLIPAGRRNRFLPALSSTDPKGSVGSAGVTCCLTAQEGWDFLIGQAGS